jgi:hypothetical protein
MTYEEIAQEYERIADAIEGDDVYFAEQRLRLRTEAARWRNTGPADAERARLDDSAAKANQSIAAANADGIEHRRLYLEHLERNTAALNAIAEAIRNR